MCIRDSIYCVGIVTVDFLASMQYSWIIRLWLSLIHICRLITSYQCDSRVADAQFLLDKQTYAARTGRVRGADDVRCV